jgi:protein TonB
MLVDAPTESDPPAEDDPPAGDECPPCVVPKPDEGVTNPRLIPESKVDPRHPDEAREAGIEGNVILEAVIDTDGSICGTKVLRTNQPGWGFEAAATEAVEQWRYEPGLKDGEPVAVCFTLFCDFTLDR